MNIYRVTRLLNESESISLEFKEARTALPANLFETICAMLNREGGDILLGVNDSGKVLGVDEPQVQAMVTHLVNLLYWLVTPLNIDMLLYAYGP